MSHRLVVVGAGYAGLLATKRLDRLLRRHDVTITLVNASDRFVERVRLHQLAAGQRSSGHPSLRRQLGGTSVRLVVGRVTAIDAACRAVTVDAPQAVGAPPASIGYDTLVYALGSGARLDDVPGAPAHAYAVADIEQAARLRDRISQKTTSGATVVVVGAGLTGVETAAELAESCPTLRVRLLTGADDVGSGLMPRARSHLRYALDRLGVSVHTKAVVTEVREDGLDTCDGVPFAAETVVWATGFRVPELAHASGFATGEDGRMLVDATLRSISHPDVYAVGDAAAGISPSGAPGRMSCQSALAMGRGVADVIAARLSGAESEPVRIGYVFTNISLGRRDGIIQFTRADDSPRRFVLTGRAAAVFKETVVRSTVRKPRGGSVCSG
ncbi:MULTISPECIES: FAD-dependent oxidoreductase [unclassified Streptomyces]|uniref:NAD(P)/FAD-dependent oxidoreductase n=1 Tax=unclassified Streptomyces TaxID=2593676 RepID=UPI001367B0AF|nr:MULTISPECIES: FAD-dependent oxidoreductase [unclassified Streptomyces]NEA04947.1 FAD-dependent oxidoreductase [Streptomyces sp. SID10116]MYY82582.1 FAD-dependent oxidoreductase [Streptomyces sp. SID335]MYZ11983.1 FAD-dependent oxidoreductase [Streptomyces sp. SID337]NDZ91425.1 FAD-dependent oxidoreductase [Streptomyces sp. SID10115]NEB45271.1 FAD-dependent oxidoreductase [Streptomyces sp. SID339]